MKIIRTKVIGPIKPTSKKVKIQATDEEGKKSFSYVDNVPPTNFPDHQYAAGMHHAKRGIKGIRLVSAPLKGNTEWIHIEQVNTWVS
jgi:hypothetical protein